MTDAPLAHPEASQSTTGQPTAAWRVLTATLGIVLAGASTVGTMSWMNARWCGEPMRAFEMGRSEYLTTAMVVMPAAAVALGVITAVLLAAMVARRVRAARCSLIVGCLLAAWVTLIVTTNTLTDDLTNTPSCGGYGYDR